jgi:hypothetical protein
MADLVILLAMANDRPYVQTACVAESILIEPDGVASVIRMVDTFTVDEPANMPANMKPATTLNVLISLKSGDVKGQSDLELVLRLPSGKTQSFGARPVDLEGGIHGANMKVALNVLGLEYGAPYWLDVFWGGKKLLLTSIPFRFRRSEAPTAPATPPS